MKKIIPLILLLAVSMLISALSVTASAVNDTLQELDYSNPSSSNIEYTASEFLELITGEKISELEAKYIDSILGEAFLYSDSVPQKNVEVEYYNNTLTVTAKKFEYISAEGTVTWTPVELIFNEKMTEMQYSEENDEYSVVLKYVEEGEGVDVSVRYVCSIPLDSEVTDTYKNYTYNYALDLWKEKGEYDSAVEKYNKEYAEYQQYLKDIEKYKSDYDLWQQYLEDKKKYDADYEEYLKYEEEMLQYSDDLKKYNDYIAAKEAYQIQLNAYKNYLAAIEKYGIDHKKYEEYMAIVARAQKKLETIESVFVKDSNGAQLYASLMGGSVDQVLANRDLLISVGKCDPNDIINAGDATEALRKLLTEYKSLKTVEERYAYYTANYNTLKDNFIKLYSSLYLLYQNPVVRAGFKIQEEAKGKQYRFMQFVAQLYVVSTGLDDEEPRSGLWKIEGEDKVDADSNYETETFGYGALLELCQRPADSHNADPSDLTLPTKVDEPKLPEVITEPVLPTPVGMPIKPDTVEKPDEVPFVSEPLPVEKVSDPGKAPDEKYYTPLQLSLIAAIDDGTLVKRKTGESHTLKFETYVSKRVSLQNKCIVTFFDYDGKTVLATYELDKGEKIVFDKELPSRASTKKYDYSFECWLNDDGESVEPDTAEERYMTFYASYSSSIKSYNVTWIVDGKTTVETYEYGQYPEYTGNVEKEFDAQYFYYFMGWSDEIKRVEEDAEYEAKFLSVLREYSVVWDFNGDKYVETYKYGETPTFKYSTTRKEDSKYLYSFAGWDKEIVSVSGDAEYTATFDSQNIVEDKNGDAVEVIDQNGIYIVKTEFDTLRVDRLLELARTRGKLVELVFLDGNALFSINSASVKDMIESGCTYIYIKEENSLYSVRFANAEDENATLKYTVSLKCSLKDADVDSMKAYISEDGENLFSTPVTYADGFVTIKIDSSASILFKNEYKVVLGECKNGVLSIDGMDYESGSKVAISLVFSDEYILEEISVVGESGTVYEINDNLEFDMPSENVTVSAKLRLKEFTVTFISDGKVISTKTYHKGDKVEVPENPTKADDGDKMYSFIYWTPTITTVTEDVTYTAVFKETVKSNGDSYVDIDASRNKFYVDIITTALIFVAVVAGVVVTIVVLVKRRKKAKAANKNADSSLK